MTPPLMREHCRMSARAERMLEIAVKHHGLSARAHDRILKLARTKADLEGHARIEDSDVQLAVDCRMLDRRGWLTASRAAEPPRTSKHFTKLLAP
jgi:magnesium chelatase family protein